MCRYPLRAPIPLWSILWPTVDPILVTCGQTMICKFWDPNLVTFYLCIYRHPKINCAIFKLNEYNLTFFHLDYKHSGTLSNRKYAWRTFLPQKSRTWDPILVTLLKMRPYYSQSSRENATPSSGTSPLASYKEVPPGYFVQIKGVLTR